MGYFIILQSRTQMFNDLLMADNIFKIIHINASSETGFSFIHRVKLSALPYTLV